MVGRYLANLVAAGFAGTTEIDDRANLLWSETELPSAPDETERPEMIFIIDPVAAFSPRRCGNNTYLLEIADRFDVDARAAGKIANGESWHKEIA